MDIVNERTNDRKRKREKRGGKEVKERERRMDGKPDAER